MKWQVLEAGFKKTMVSLFTREWIEIGFKMPACTNCNSSPSLRGSGLKFPCRPLQAVQNPSPSLRGSGLKFSVPCYLDNGDYVSLFTREWIEILQEIAVMWHRITSPSLRGSGLKFAAYLNTPGRKRLPLYEGVD